MTANVRLDPEAAEQMARSLDAAFPNLAELARTASHEGGLGGCDDDTEFAFALDLILDGLDRLREGGGRASSWARAGMAASVVWPFPCPYPRRGWVHILRDRVARVTHSVGQTS